MNWTNQISWRKNTKDGPSVRERKKRIRPLLPGTTVELTWQKLLLAYLANGSISTYTSTHTHIYIYTFLPTRQYEVLYSLKGHLTEYLQRLAETLPNITTLYKRIKLSLSTFQGELRTLSATLIPLYIPTNFSHHASLLSTLYAPIVSHNV